MDQLTTFLLRHWQLSAAFIALAILLLLAELINKLTSAKQVTPQQAIILLNRHDAIAIDLRDAQSFEQGHIVGAVNLPQAELLKDKKMTKLQKYRQRSLILCSDTPVSPQLKALLKQQGYQDVHVLAGGIRLWRQDNLPLVKS